MMPEEWDILLKGCNSNIQTTNKRDKYIFIILWIKNERSASRKSALEMWHPTKEIYQPLQLQIQTQIVFL